ncbi:hypothetical protein CLOM_g20223, partial [Closterium sp. NIES-68]
LAVLDKLGTPKDKSALRALLGFVNYCHKFQWGAEEEAARRDLLEAVKAGTLLQIPQKGAPFVLYTDWSRLGLGAVLCQNIQGEERVVAYARRSCSATEANYSSYEGKGLAAIWGVTHSRVYLQRGHFTLITDHQPLQWLMKNQLLTGRNARWAMRLQEHDFEIQHWPGKTLQQPAPTAEAAAGNNGIGRGYHKQEPGARKEGRRHLAGRGSNAVATRGTDL